MIKFKIIIVLLCTCFQVNAQFFNKTGSSFKNNTVDSIDIKYITSHLYENESVYTDELKSKKIVPRKSAIVLIDLWEEDFLNPMINEFINPLLTEVNDLGFHIIYAPSQFEQNSNLKILDNSVTLYNLDRMDDYITENEITNVFYVGFDALYCVIDKPNGIFSFKERNVTKKINYFVFEKGVSSYTKEMKESAIALFKKNKIGVIPTDNFNYKNVFPKETKEDPFRKTINRAIPGNDFVLIFKNNKHDEELLNFTKKLHDSHIEFAEVKNDKLYYGDKILENQQEFIQLLISLSIDNIYYAGYYLNNEILWSKFGITNMYIKKRYFFINKLPKIFVLNDLAYIAPDSNLSPIVEKSVIINHYRNISNILSEQLFKPKSKIRNVLFKFESFLKRMNISEDKKESFVYGIILCIIIIFIPKLYLKRKK